MSAIADSIFEALGIDPDDFRWQDLALCAAMGQTEMFFDMYESDSNTAAAVDQMCLSCPVMKQCLETGINDKAWGVWGGTFLILGKQDPARNSHKTPDIWESIRNRIIE